jgi:SET domain-containing protein
LDVPNLSYLSQKTVVQESRIHNLGLFARECIAKGEIVAINGGYIFHSTTLHEVEKRLGPAQIAVAGGFCIGPLSTDEREGTMIFSNYSCDPNIGIQGQILLVAMRDIQPGEELTHDWATTDHDTYEMPSNCGARHCRGIITGQDWRRKDLQQKYQGYIAWYLQRKIDAGE